MKDEKFALSLRDYLVRLRNSHAKIIGNIVLAETVQQLYRDTNYPDLISFEEDVARLSSIVLVISESAGSLAELGAFYSEQNIFPALRILVSEDYFNHESFVRYGPIKRVENENRNRIGTFPWRYHKNNGHLVKSSVERHYQEIIKFINDHIKQIPTSYSYSNLNNKVFYDIIWILSLLDVVPPDSLFEALRVIGNVAIDHATLRSCMYVLKTVGWVKSFAYSGRDYYYLPVNADPFEYSFIAGLRVRDVSTVKMRIAQTYGADANIGKAIRRRLIECRSGGQ